MKTGPVSPGDFARSVIAVPPLALNDDLSLNVAANAALVHHIEAGGVTTLLYGGNANVHNLPIGHFAAMLDAIGRVAGAETWVIPSIGPDYGKLVDQARLLRDTAFPCAMALPMIAPQTPAGVERGLREAIAACGRPLIVYIKMEDYLPPAALGRMFAAGELCGIKYAVPRDDLTDDPYLAGIVEAVGRDVVVSGMGELPAAPHLRTFGLAGFTSGCVCIAPRASMNLLQALRGGDARAVETALAPFRTLETLRERHGQIQVLHDAVTASGIADMGPILPLLSNVGEPVRSAVAEAARALIVQEASLSDAATSSGSRLRGERDDSPTVVSAYSALPHAGS